MSAKEGQDMSTKIIEQTIVATSNTRKIETKWINLNTETEKKNNVVEEEVVHLEVQIIRLVMISIWEKQTKMNLRLLYPNNSLQSEEMVKVRDMATIIIENQRYMSEDLKIVVEVTHAEEINTLNKITRMESHSIMIIIKRKDAAITTMNHHKEVEVL